MKKYLTTIILMVLLLANVYAIDIDIPQVLKDLGYANEDLLSYRKDYDKEYFTMKNWQTGESTNTITYVILEGEIIDWQSPSSDK